MDKFFLVKSHCELAITSQKIDAETMKSGLNVEPFCAYSKGDPFFIKVTGHVANRFQSLWAVRSETIVSENEDITPHLLYFRSLLDSKMDQLSIFICDPLCDVSFWIWIETEDAGIGIDLSEDDLAFIKSISNRVHLSIIANRKII